MTPVLETLKSLQQTTLSAITTTQSKVVDANRRLATTVAKRLPNVEIPTVGDVRPAQVVDQAFGFTADLVEANRKFTSELVAAWAPAPSK